jgi:uncharacterized protein YukE
VSDTQPLPRLTELQREIAGETGMWNAAVLHLSTAYARAEGSPGGTGAIVDRIADDYARAAKSVHAALAVVAEIRRQRLPAVWSGDTHVAASAAVAAAERGLERGVDAMSRIAGGLRRLAAVIEPAGKRDLAGAGALGEAHTLTEEITAGVIPDPFSYDGATMRRAHHLAMDGVAERVAAHTLVSEASREVGGELHDLAAQARLSRLAGSPLSPVDELLLTDAGSTGDSMDGAVLSAVMADRASQTLGGMGEADRARMAALLAGGKSAEQRAYLMRALAAGYDIDEIAGFNDLIGPYGDDPAWLREHLTPIDLTGPAPALQQAGTLFQGAEWSQGKHPTCVAASTVTARAQVDPLYALQLTTGGHPGDPRYDNPTAFAERLRDEQIRVFDGGRPWYQKLPLLDGGMTPGQSETVADEEIGARTGADYRNRSIDSAAERREVLPEIERAVDEGNAVPFTTREGWQGHQMLIVEHDGELLQIYNPWGYTVWINADDFVNGRLDKIDPAIPDRPSSVRLPTR